MDNSNCNVLLVDDDREFTKLVAEKLLLSCGSDITVTTAGSFDEALSLASSHTFDFAFVDCFLGEARSGRALIREFRQRGCDFPVAILSEATRGPLRRSALDLGAITVIDKARCNADQLAEVIDVGTGTWCMTGEFKVASIFEATLRP